MGVLLLVTIAILAGFVLIILANRTSPPIAGEKDFYEARSRESQRLEDLPFSQFERICLKLLEELGLVINSYRSDGEGSMDVSAINPQPVIGGEYIIHCYHARKGGPVESTRVIALSDTVKAEGASKGIFITNGYFSEEVPKLFEGPPIELINGQRLNQLLAEHRIPLT